MSRPRAQNTTAELQAKKDLVLSIILRLKENSDALGNDATVRQLSGLWSSLNLTVTPPLENISEDTAKKYCHRLAKFLLDARMRSQGSPLYSEQDNNVVNLAQTIYTQSSSNLNKTLIMPTKADITPERKQAIEERDLKYKMEARERKFGPSNAQSPSTQGGPPASKGPKP